MGYTFVYPTKRMIFVGYTLNFALHKIVDNKQKIPLLKYKRREKICL